MDKLKLDLQLALERSSIERGLERINAQIDRDARAGMVHPVGARMLDAAVEGATASIRELQAETQAALERSWGGQKGQNPAYRLLILSLDAEVLAFLGVRVVMTALKDERRLQDITSSYGRAIEDTLWLSEVSELEKDAARERKYTPRNRIPHLRQSLSKYGTRVIKRWRSRLDDLPATTWAAKDRIAAGGALLARVMPHLSGMVSREVERMRSKNGQIQEKILIRVKSTFVETLSQEAGRAALMRPMFLPMVVPPRDWDRGGRGLQGGYVQLRAHGLKSRAVTLDEGDDDVGNTQVEDLGEEHLQALNAIQSVPYVINDYTLTQALRAFETDTGPLPYEPELAMPDRMGDEEWSKLSREERLEPLTKRRMVYDHNNRQAEAKLAHTRALSIADEFRDEEVIYFPHAMDYRGRFYPIPQDLHPQGPDMVKSLLKLGESKPLGERGLVWLECHTANTYGLDKEDRLTQQMWTTANWDRIMLVGQDPWLDLEFWQGADEPWQFLAAAHEMYLAHSSDDPASYESNLVVSVDGSCNGLQHLSAMGLDPVGAKAVNLMSGPRQDIYQIVADKVNTLLKPDSVWVGRVSRKTVKRAVMTTPYGVTKAGIADQLKSDGFTRGMENENEAAKELRDLIVEALDGTIVKGVEIMGWFKECAGMLAKDNRGISWETPTGTVVSMCNRKPRQRRVITPLGEMYVADDPTAKDEMRTSKQSNSVAPNIIHSFDAAHLAKVVLAFDGQVCAVHDSFGTHASDVDALLESTKREFISIYQEDWFTILRGSITFHSGRPAIPQSPERGDLDITKVAESDYFFA